MLIGSLPFVVYLKIVHGDWKSFIKDDQIKLFIFLIFIIVGLTTIWLSINSSENYLYLFRLAAFNITSILTGTGYSSSNFSLWGGFGLVIMFIIMFIGGCAGSTTGGIKILDFYYYLELLNHKLKKLCSRMACF